MLDKGINAILLIRFVFLFTVLSFFQCLLLLYPLRFVEFQPRLFLTLSLFSEQIAA